MTYAPEKAPDPEQWLALDEASRVEQVLRYHRRAGVALPNAMLHASIHVAVETQVAMGDEIPVSRTVDRLMAEGLDRHDAIHAVGSVLASHMYDLMAQGGPRGDPNAAYWRALESLNSRDWKRGR